MSYSIPTSIRALVAPRSAVRIRTGLWNDMLVELARRGQGERESGAFLLAAATGSRATTVMEVVYFDDLDPTCLTGGITLHSEGFDRLWALCTREALRVIADVHTHPGRFVHQSAIDRTNPMIATPGHVAIIVPHYAQSKPAISACGVHTYRGAHKWDTSTGTDAERIVHIQTFTFARFTFGKFSSR